MKSKKGIVIGIGLLVLATWSIAQTTSPLGLVAPQEVRYMIRTVVLEGPIGPGSDELAAYVLRQREWRKEMDELSKEGYELKASFYRPSSAPGISGPESVYTFQKKY